MGTMKTTDFEIRRALYRKTLYDIKKEDPFTKIIDELGLCQGDARIDIAAINGAIHGFEIKSESDDLRRLPTQIELYNKVLDTITIVTSMHHITKIKKIIPSWWGIIIVEKKLKNNIILHNESKADSNSQIDPNSLVQLLWREEALNILKEKNLEKGLINKPRMFLWNKLVKEFPLERLKSYIIEILKSRQKWRD